MTTPTKPALTLEDNFAVSSYRHTLSNGHTVDIVKRPSDKDDWIVRSEDGLEYCRVNSWQGPKKTSRAYTLNEAVEVVNKLEDAIATATPIDKDALRELYRIDGQKWSDVRARIQRYPELMQALLDLPSQLQVKPAPTLELSFWTWQDDGTDGHLDLVSVRIGKDQKCAAEAQELNCWVEEQNLIDLLFVGD